MNSMVNYFKNSYTVVILVIILTIIATYIEGKVSKREEINYTSNLIVVTSVSALITYINTNSSLPTEEVMTGIAPF